MIEIVCVFFREFFYRHCKWSNQQMHFQNENCFVVCSSFNKTHSFKLVSSHVCLNRKSTTTFNFIKSVRALNCTSCQHTILWEIVSLVEEGLVTSTSINWNETINSTDNSLYPKFIIPILHTKFFFESLKMSLKRTSFSLR